MVEEKRGAAVNAVVHGEQEEDKGDDRQEAIGSDNTGGDGAKTDGIAEREQKGVVEEGTSQEAMDSAAREHQVKLVKQKSRLCDWCPQERMAAKTAFLKVEITSPHKLQTYHESIF